MLKLDDQNILHLIDTGMVKESPCRRSRNFQWCVGDGGRGVCSSDVHHMVQKPVSTAQMKFTLTTRQLMVDFFLSRSHAFRYERKNTNPTSVRIELTISALAGAQVTY